MYLRYLSEPSISLSTFELGHHDLDRIVEKISSRRKAPPPVVFTHIRYYCDGRSYQLFKGALRSDKTLQLYKQHLFHFCDFIKMTTEEIISKFGGENAKESVKLQHMIEDYAMVLQTKVRDKEITAATAAVTIIPIKLLCEMNDIIINWRKIGKLLPHGYSNAAD